MAWICILHLNRSYGAGGNIDIDYLNSIGVKFSVNQAIDKKLPFMDKEFDFCI